MATIQYLGDNGPDGTVLAPATTSLLGFYGATPVDRPAAVTAVPTTAITSPSVTGFTGGSTAHIVFGYTTSTQADAIPVAISSLINRVAALQTAVNSIRTNLNELGLQS
jgi:hypothetical protein